jgi:UDP-N-acetylglucosamine--N-acetylmuramyl-(pentapeptide) pyrophosphoryl-undecaprenol N-acetylglucosamine transferase
MIDRLLIAGGGTGGHVYPAVAVAEEVLARNPKAEVIFIGTAHGMEARILPRLGYDLRTINASRLVGAGLWTRLKGLLNLVAGCYQSWRILRAHKPQVVLGMGGYVSGPALLAAWTARYPTAIQEQNAAPGFTNRALGKLVRAIYLGFDAARSRFNQAKTCFTGNPIRHALADTLASAEHRPFTPNQLRVLVFGGSQGARFLNECVPNVLIRLATEHPQLQLSVVHQTGIHDEDVTRTRYAETPLEQRVQVTPYIDDMPSAYADADITICRAGALTIAEITAVGLPSLLVPFPHAAGNHQEANAKALVDAGAAHMVRQAEWQEDDVVRWLSELLNGNGETLETMSRQARQVARPRAAARLVDDLERIAGVHVEVSP